PPWFMVSTSVVLAVKKPFPYKLQVGFYAVKGVEERRYIARTEMIVGNTYGFNSFNLFNSFSLLK
ncbi:hypothetical protein, partial [Hoylesella oralis]